jgi:hypothetical protein
VQEAAYVEWSLYTKHPLNTLFSPLVFCLDDHRITVRAKAPQYPRSRVQLPRRPQLWNKSAGMWATRGLLLTQRYICLSVCVCLSPVTALLSCILIALSCLPDIAMKSLMCYHFLSYQVTSLLGDVDVAVKKARLAVQSTSDTANTILKDVVTATEVMMSTHNIEFFTVI